MRRASRILYTIAGAAAVSLSLALAGPVLAAPFFLGSLGAVRSTELDTEPGERPEA